MLLTRSRYYRQLNKTKGRKVVSRVQRNSQSQINLFNGNSAQLNGRNVKKGKEFLRYAAVIALITIASGLVLRVCYEIYASVKEKYVPDVQGGEQHAIKKFSKKLVAKVKKHPWLERRQLISRLALAKDDETKVIKFIDANFNVTSDQMKAILNGAHVRLNDDGLAYKKWTALCVSKTRRVSSHPASDAQFSIQGTFTKELLFSVNQDKDNSRQYTWFQLENEPWYRPVPHLADYFVYRFTKENQGPYGTSKYTDKQPLILNLKNKGASLDTRSLDCPIS